MSGANDHIFKKTGTEFGINAFFEGIEQHSGNAAQVKGDQSSAFAVNIHSNDFDVQIVVHTFVEAQIEVSGQIDSGRRGDDFLSVTDFKHFFSPEILLVGYKKSFI
jgi:hypothetical protein